MRNEDQVRVQHMIDAAESAVQFLADRSRAALDSDSMLLFAVVHAIEVTRGRLQYQREHAKGNSGYPVDRYHLHA